MFRCRVKYVEKEKSVSGLHSWQAYFYDAVDIGVGYIETSLFVFEPSYLSCNRKVLKLQIILISICQLCRPDTKVSYVIYCSSSAMATMFERGWFSPIGQHDTCQKGVPSRVGRLNQFDITGLFDNIRQVSFVKQLSIIRNPLLKALHCVTYTSLSFTYTHCLQHVQSPSIDTSW